MSYQLVSPVDETVIGGYVDVVPTTHGNLDRWTRGEYQNWKYIGRAYPGWICVGFEFRGVDETVFFNPYRKYDDDWKHTESPTSRPPTVYETTVDSRSVWLEPGAAAWVEEDDYDGTLVYSIWRQSIFVKGIFNRVGPLLLYGGRSLLYDSADGSLVFGGLDQ